MIMGAAALTGCFQGDFLENTCEQQGGCTVGASTSGATTTTTTSPPTTSDGPSTSTSTSTRDLGLAILRGRELFGLRQSRQQTIQLVAVGTGVIGIHIAGGDENVVRRDRLEGCDRTPHEGRVPGNVDHDIPAAVAPYGLREIRQAVRGLPVELDGLGAEREQVFAAIAIVAFSGPFAGSPGTVKKRQVIAPVLAS